MQLTRARAVIFDMDGTLLDNQHIHNQVWAEFLAEHGIVLSPDEIGARTAAMPNREILRLFFDGRLSDETLGLYASEKERRYRERFIHEAEPLPGLRDVLGALQAQRVPLALATSASPVNMQATLDALGLRDAFQTTISAADVARGKPDPEPFLLAAARLEVPPSACVVFEDSLLGLEAAHRAGMPAIAVATSYSPERLAAQPGVRHVIRDYVGLDLAHLLAGDDRQ